MKIRCIKNNLEKILQQAENFIGKNLELEILSCIILETKNNYLTIESTNINTSYFSEIPVIVEKEGRVAIKGDIFYKTISAIKDKEIVLELEKNILKINSKNSKIEINILAHEDFPGVLKNESFNKNELEIEIMLPSIDFIDGLVSTLYAVSKSNIKPELASIFILINSKNISFVATDGFRLAEKTLKYNIKINNEFSFLLPSDSISPIIKTLSIIENEKLNILVYKNQIFIKSSGFTIFSRLTKGEYVDYKKLIPTDDTTSVVVLKQNFIDSLKLINIYSNEFNQIKIIVKNKKFFLETNNNFGKNKTELDAVVSGEDLEMNFNFKYIQDSFSSIKTDSFELIFNPTKPLLIKPISEKNFKYIVMPLSR